MSDFQKQNKILSREMPIINPEIPSVPEIFEVQSNVEKPREIQPEQPSSVPAPTPSHVIPASDRVEHPQTKSQELQAIEKVMASGLEEIYNNLDSKTKQMLKLEGEKTASQIEILLEQGKDAAKKVLQLIRDWLHKIPGVNRFFLEQESKIKTDKILAMTNRGK